LFLTPLSISLSQHRKAPNRRITARSSTFHRSRQAVTPVIPWLLHHHAPGHGEVTLLFPL
jgi:hypothetical protein